MQAVVSGWGILEEGGNSQPDILQEVEVETMTNNEVHQQLLLDTQLNVNIAVHHISQLWVQRNPQQHAVCWR